MPGPLIKKIVSGGQTGVDRAALDAALQTSTPCGGWCPEDRVAEDGKIPDRYPLVELKNAGYSERTLQNVIDSDGTLIIYFDSLSGGTEKTLLFCLENNKPYLLIDASEIPAPRAVKRISEFVKKKNLNTLNVAGPRASSAKPAYNYTNKVICRVLEEQNPQSN